MVGANTSPPLLSPTPDFGRRRRARLAREQEQCDDSNANNDDDEATRAALEAEARRECHEHYDFLQRPAYMPSWRPFLRELRRYELTWLLTPLAGGELTLTLRDYEERDERDRTLCTLRGSGRSCAPIADLLAACTELLLPQKQQRSPMLSERSVAFATESGAVTHELCIAPTRHSITTPPPPPLAPTLAQGHATCVSVDVAVRDKATSLRTPLLHRVALQTFVHAVLVSVPALLKRSDTGVRNNDLIDSAQRRDFRFLWCLLRREICMTPVDITELDLLLPPP